MFYTTKITTRTSLNRSKRLPTPYRDTGHTLYASNANSETILAGGKGGYPGTGFLPHLPTHATRTCTASLAHEEHMCTSHR
eukprot:2621291-Prymnesium_polylepis.1